jgi:hypothetical protein
MNAGVKRSVICAAALMGLTAGGTTSAVEVLYIGPANGNWDSDPNWLNSGPDNSFSTAGDNSNTQPAAADNPIILNGSTVDISTAETVNELHMSRGNVTGVPAQSIGTAQLNVLPGASLITAGGGGVRIGRNSGAGVGDNKAIIIQTGGLVQSSSGTNGIRLSQSDTTAVIADSYYEISGGSLRGGTTNGTMTGPLQIGIVNNTTDWDEAEFHVVGTGPTEIRVEDLRMQANSLGAGDSILHYSIDALGVTPIIVEDEMRFSGENIASVLTVGNNLLEIDLIGLAPEADILLVSCDRIGVSNAPAEIFTGMPDGTPIVKQFGGYEYTWLLDYFDTNTNDGVLDSFIQLDFQSKVLIPEPTSLALVGVGALMLARRRRA